MIKNYLKIAWRNLWKNKGFSAINIFGLATGIACCLLITLYVTNEFSYDNFHEKGKRIVRVVMQYGSGNDLSKVGVTGTKVAPAFKRAFPEVEAGVRCMRRIGL
jgi:putative ABC transport system permease protein